MFISRNNQRNRISYIGTYVVSTEQQSSISGLGYLATLHLTEIAADLKDMAVTQVER